jgi:hypothetical protein
VAFSLERQIGKSGKLAVNYLNTRGIHQLFTHNVNAPKNYAEPDASRPDPLLGNIYEYSSGGIFKQWQLITNVTFRTGTHISFDAYYVFGHANGDVAGTTSAPGFSSNQYNLRADYGRSPFDVRQKLFAAATLSLPASVRLSPYVVAKSGAPYNLTVGRDLNADSIYNDRPGLTSVKTGYPSPCGGVLFLDPNPGPGEQVVDTNCATGPLLASVNLKISKAFRIGKRERHTGASTSGFGSKGPSGGIGSTSPEGVGAHGLAMSNGHYTLAVGATIINLLNRVNAGAPIGVLDSPLFGHSVALVGAPYSSRAAAANREIGLGIRFEF